MNASQILAAITPVIEALEELEGPYHIGGSVASSIYGLLRAAIDADLIADLRMEHVRPLVIRLQNRLLKSERESPVMHLGDEAQFLVWGRGQGAFPHLEQGKELKYNERKTRRDVREPCSFMSTNWTGHQRSTPP
jgi:hypothetical protein